MASIEELLSVLDPTRLNRVVNEIERISENIERLTDTVTGDATRALEEAEKKVKGVQTTTNEALDDIDLRFQKMIDDNIFRIHVFGDEWEKVGERVERKWKEVTTEIHRQMNQVRGPLGGVGSAMGLSGNRGVIPSAMTQIRSIANTLPMGGALGLILYGRFQQAEWMARGQRIARVFSQVGDIGTKAASKFSSFATNLQLQIGLTEGEISAAAEGFAQFGINMETALSEGEFAAQGFNKGILGTALAFDVMTKSSAGTTSQLIGMATEVGGEFEKSADAIFRFGMGLRGVGANYAKTMAGISQGLSTLRLQRQGVEDLTQGYEALRKAMSERFGGGPQAQALALQGTMAAASGIAGMSEGMMAYIGGRVGNRTGSGPREAGIEAIIAFQEGTLGPQSEKQTKFFGEILKEMSTFAGEVTNQGSRSERIFALMRSGGFSFEGARAIIDVQEKIDSDIQAGMPTQEAIKKGQKELNNAFKSRRAEQSEFNRVIKKLLFELAQLGGDLLNVTVATLPRLVDMTQALLALGTAATPQGMVKQLFGDKKDAPLTGLKDAMDRLSDPVRQTKIQQRMDKSWSAAEKRIGNIMRILGNTAEMTVGKEGTKTLKNAARSTSLLESAVGNNPIKGKETAYNVPHLPIRAYVRFETDNPELEEPSSLYG